MGIADSFKDKAEQAVDKVGADRAKDGVEQAGDKVDDLTGGKYAEHVDKGQNAAGDYIEKLDGDASNQ